MSYHNFGPPPEDYMAKLIATELMRSGASMYGRKEDATCVLKVGTRRYYVHVQLLAVSVVFSRSLVFGPSSHTVSPCVHVYLVVPRFARPIAYHWEKSSEEGSLRSNGSEVPR